MRSQDLVMSPCSPVISLTRLLQLQYNVFSVIPVRADLLTPVAKNINAFLQLRQSQIQPGGPGGVNFRGKVGGCWSIIRCASQIWTCCGAVCAEGGSGKTRPCAIDLHTIGRCSSGTSTIRPLDRRTQCLTDRLRR